MLDPELNLWQREVSPLWHIWTIQDQVNALKRFERARLLRLDHTRWVNCQLNDQGVEEYTILADSGKSAGHKSYQVTTLSCTCPDAQKAPWGWCKHRIAVWLDSNAHRAHEASPAEMLQDLADLFN